MEEKFIEEQKHKEFVKEGEFGGNLFKKKALLKIIIVPLDVSKIRVNYQSQEMRDWLKRSPYGDYSWNPFLNGVRAMKYNEEKEKLSFVALLFRNATVSYCKELPYSSPENKFISLRKIVAAIKQLMSFAGKFYGKIKFDDSARIYLQLTGVKESLLDLRKVEGRTPYPYSLEFEAKWHDENLNLDEESLGKEITESPPKITKKIADRLTQAFGIWGF